MKNKSRAKNGAPLKFLTEACSYEGDDCLLWPFAERTGYGLLGIGGKMVTAHREVCRRVHGEPPTETSEAAHNCGNSLCVNPTHIRWAEPKDNQADRKRHGTSNEGDRNGNSKLTPNQVRYVRRTQRSARELAELLGVNRATIEGIRSGRYWQNL